VRKDSIWGTVSILLWVGAPEGGGEDDACPQVDCGDVYAKRGKRTNALVYVPPTSGRRF
jgi:hypothetical protein